MDASVVVSLVVMALVSAGVIGLRQFVAQTLSQRHQLGLLAAVFIVICCTTIFDSNHSYVTNFQTSSINLIRQTTMLALIALGAAVVIIAGGIDLSAGSVMAFSASICATFMMLLAPDEMSQIQPVGTGVIFLSITGTLIVGVLIGSLHAWLITEVGLPPFVATLGTLVGLRSLCRAIIEGVNQSVLSRKKSNIDVGDVVFRDLCGSVLGTALLVAILALFLWLLLSKTVTGRHLYALGGNENAARLSGIQTNRVKWLAYCISAFLSSVAGIIAFGQNSSADPQTLARGYELNAIAAAVVGGCSLQGGVGTIPGTLLGALFLRVVIDGVAKTIKTDADIYEGLIVGVLVVVAVTFTTSSDSLSRRRKLFSGALGWVTIFNLTLLAAVMTSLLGSTVVGGNLQLDLAWLSCIAGASVFSMLLIVRSSSTPRIKRYFGVAWGIATVVTTIGLDNAFPRIQRSLAVSAVSGLHGSITQNDAGEIIVDLANSTCDDFALKRILPRLKWFANVAEIRLAHTAVTDSSLDAIGVAFRDNQTLKRLDTTDTKVTDGALMRIKRAFSELETH